MILKLLNLTTSNLKQPNFFIKIKNLPPNLTEVDPGLSWHWKKKLNVVVSKVYQPVNTRWCPKSPGRTSDIILLLSDGSLLKGKDKNIIIFRKVAHRISLLAKQSQLSIVRYF